MSTEMTVSTALTGPRSEQRAETLGSSFAVFRSYRSPQVIAAALTISSAARIALGGWRWGDLLIMAIIVALLPFIEWFTHVVLLHWKPKRLLGITLDPLAAREHRKHHLDPRDVRLIFVPLPAHDTAAREHATMTARDAASVLSLMAIPCRTARCPGPREAQSTRARAIEGSRGNGTASEQERRTCGNL